MVHRGGLLSDGQQLDAKGYQTWLVHQLHVASRPSSTFEIRLSISDADHMLYHAYRTDLASQGHGCPVQHVTIREY